MSLPADHLSDVRCFDLSHAVTCCRYVHQEVLLPGSSTVSEYLTFHAALRLPRPPGAGGGGGGGGAAAAGDASDTASSHAAVVRCRVLQVVQELGLAKVAHSFIGDAFVRGLSGEPAGLLKMPSGKIGQTGLMDQIGKMGEMGSAEGHHSLRRSGNNYALALACIVHWIQQTEWA